MLITDLKYKLECEIECEEVDVSYLIIVINNNRFENETILYSYNMTVSLKNKHIKIKQPARGDPYP